MAARLRPMGQCAVCRSWDAQTVCADCVARLAPAVPRCRRCGLRVGSAVAMCGACLADPPPFDACSVGCDYVFPWDRLIADFKFNGRVELATALARRLLDAVRRDAAALPQWVLPVPLAPQRLAERGYNQAWELARRVARDLGCHCRSTVAGPAAGRRAPGRAGPGAAAEEPARRLRAEPVADACRCTAGMSRWSTT